MLSSDAFIKRAKELILEYVREHVDPTDDLKIDATSVDVYVVWSTFVLGYQKALLSTSLPDGLYYEITYDVGKNKIYFDAYKRWENRVIDVEG